MKREIFRALRVAGTGVALVILALLLVFLPARALPTQAQALGTPDPDAAYMYQWADYEEAEPPAAEDWEEEPPMRGENSSAGKSKLSAGVQNIVKRARQMTEITWTAAADLEGWKAKPADKFYAGQTYKGIPYGQPHRSGSYVPWETDLQAFLEASRNPNGAFYTQRAVSQVKRNEAPYYSSECSAFVSWAWGLPQRYTTKTLDQVANYVGQDLSALEVGDILLKPGSHVRLVVDLTHDSSGALTGVRIMEEREPAAQSHWYRTRYQRQTIDALQQECLDQGYTIYRFPGRDRVSYTHSCAVPLAGDVCPRCGCNPFRDVSLNTWYTQAVAFVNNQGFMTGTGVDTFEPGTVVDRAQTVTILWRLYGSPKSETQPGFADAKKKAYYYQALCWAVERGLVKGTGDGRFTPMEPCTRAQTVTMLWRAAGQPKASTTDLPFTDAKKKAYYFPALCWAVEQGIVKGATPDRFGPDAMTTRAETAAMIQRFCKAMGMYQ